MKMELADLIFDSPHPSGDMENDHLMPALVSAFLEAARVGDFESVRKIIDGNSLLIWFYVAPDQLGPIVDAAAKNSSGPLDACAVFHMFLTDQAEYRRFMSLHISSRVEQFPMSPPLFPMLEVFNARLQGRVTEAHSLFENAFPTQQPFEQFRDLRNAWPQFVAVQKGISATLAGHLFEALGYFHDAILRPSPSHLEFLTRDALVKGALIHAAFGDPAEANSMLHRASIIRRTASWVEEGIDASAELAGLLAADDAATMMERLSTIDSAHIGEMWPFYVHAHYRFLETARSNSFALKKIAFLKSLPFAAIHGDGYSGSVFHLAEASLSIAAGSPQRARKQLELADQDFVLSRVLSMLLELQVGSNTKVVQLGSEIRDVTLPLRRMELWRISLLAQAHVNLGQETEAIHVLSHVDSLPRPLDRSEAAYFSSEIRNLAGAGFSHWPEASVGDERYLDILPSHDVQLSAREYQILLLLTSGRPNKELANQLFISVNTLKSQLQTIYRKLGARSREEALRNAATRGLL